jgi:SAM-dependent MidA family methyltransferase
LDSTGQRKHINPVARVIQDEIARAGVMDFARFMQLALYHSEHGYYQHSRIGRRGDFFTSVSVGPLFGQMLAFFLSERLEKVPGQLQILEAGANDGALARDILTWLHSHRPALGQRVTYCIHEPIPALRMRQQQTLAGHGVKWLDEIPEVRGALVSNELLDAFPAHVYRWQKADNCWREFGVNADFQWAAMQRIEFPEFAPLETYLPDQFQIEISPAAETWWQAAAHKLQDGLLLAIDYGEETIAPRTNGTLRAYRNHRLVNNPLANPGEQDITTSVNFGRIRGAGEATGLVSEPLQTQGKFFSKLAARFLPSPAQARQFHTLTHPEHLGRAFKVLVQSRNAAA